MNSNWEWIRRELAATGCEAGTVSHKAIYELVTRLEWYTLTDAEKEFVVDSFASLARGHALPRPTEELENWKECVPGDYMIGNTVRVRPSAYQGEHGMWHNGKRGKVIGSRNNSVVVRYDNESAEEACHHSPAALEVLVP